MKMVGFIRKNGIFDKISGFFAIYRKGYYNKQKEQSPQDWRRTVMEEGNAKSLVRRLPIKNRITLMVILISVVPILIISVFSYAKAFISVRQTVRAFAAQTLTSLERSLTNLADPSRLLAGGQEKLPEEVLKTEPTGLFQQEALRYLTGVTVLYTDGTVCSLAGEEILAVTESGGWAITQNEVGEQRLAVAWYATDEEGNAYTVQALFMPQMFTRLLDIYNEESCNRLVLVDGAGGLLTDDGTPLTVLEGEVIRQTAFEVSGEPICPREERSSFLCYLTVPALEAIEENLSQHISLEMISETVHMTENYVSRLFKSESGMNVVGYINMEKMEQARRILSWPESTVRMAAGELGYYESSYFIKLFRKTYGIGPGEYKKFAEDRQAAPLLKTEE